MARLLAALLLVAPAAVHGQTPTVVTDDVGRFWRAFDAVSAAPDSAARYRLLDELFVEPGTPGLHALMARRGYTAESYVRAITEYPRFWASVRDNTLRADRYAGEIEDAVGRLRDLYPALRPATVYFTVGALMTNGTTLDSLVLVGSELALADRSAETDELPERLGANLRRYFDTDPVEDVVLLNVHEVVHTQQGPFGSDLLAVALQEGVAEYVSVLAMGVTSAAPAVAFGEAHRARVLDRFATEMFSGRWNDWLYNDTSNAFGVRDLGYYVGYAIAQGYVERAEDRARAVARLVELDYQDARAVEAVVEASRTFDRPLDDLRGAYERGRPTVVEVVGLDEPEAGTARVTVVFSAPMNPRFRGFDYGPLGEDGVLRVTDVVGWSDDRTRLTVEVALEAGRHQVTLTDQFRDDDGRGLVPHLVDVTAPR